MKIQEILEYLDGEKIEYKFFGNKEDTVDGFSSLKQYKDNTFTWIKKSENLPSNDVLFSIKLAFLQEGLDTKIKNKIITNESKRAFFCTIEHFFSTNDNIETIGKNTYIGPNVKIGKNVIIGHNCTLDGNISIGDNTRLWNNITIINRVKIGENCDIQSGTVIGHDGFGYTEDKENRKTMIKHFGGVIIGDNVHIGMNCVIARAVIDDTIIGNGTKMSDLVHIGHNNIIGENCTLINCAVFGSCEIGDNVYIVYSVIKNQTKIGNNAFIGMNSNVIQDVKPNITVFGNPAKEYIHDN